ncbi:acyl carrier protein [Solwaraspora sp. WMMD792]|uniref:acyl carrier protein n=1 Tax=Solwaraspora sp. WMMD792 TaxID=3016099 RepID=UPI002417D103|nr:acyl carrier protein [Solwaraspora sp. WMMD792]MDG4772592.1 acyl carrier protein [Solwaraspora sp. WMMD792]
MDTTTLRQRVMELVDEATGGTVPVNQLTGGGSLIALGVDSLGLLRLVDAVEAEFGVEVEFDGPGQRMDTLDDLVAAIVDARDEAEPDRATTPG